MVTIYIYNSCAAKTNKHNSGVAVFSATWSTTVPDVCSGIAASQTCWFAPYVCADPWGISKQPGALTKMEALDEIGHRFEENLRANTQDFPQNLTNHWGNTVLEHLGKKMNPRESLGLIKAELTSRVEGDIYSIL
jgi:hypothetical protein